MCGIVGVSGKLHEDQKSYQIMLQTLRHRGPDDTGNMITGNFYLGHQRLSIVDLETGHQPLQSSQNDLNVVCNGEIYNHEQLRQRCQDYQFLTRSDTEVLLPLYQRDKSDFVKQLDGMFSFILRDGDGFFVARDPIGIKPLYYGVDGDRMYFASEFKALVKHAERIHEFPNGHFYHPAQGFKSYYQWPKERPFISDVDIARQKIRQSLRQSVKKRLMADVPVGVFLSGGLDSSLIAALMKAELPELHSFSVGFANSADLAAARKVADHLGTIHHEYVYAAAEMMEVLPQVLYHLESFDPALVRSAIPCYFVSRLAKKFVKVILTGEGADELFAGYSYLADYDAPALHTESQRILQGLHNINLQRVDRMTMAHGLEGRVPFLDIDFVETVLSIDPALKRHQAFGIEKWLLRKTFEDLLPPEIIWRDKMEFAQGCGSSTVIEQRAAQISADELRDAEKRGEPISSKEEKLYYDIFKDLFDHPDASNLFGRWAGTLH